MTNKTEKGRVTEMLPNLTFRVKLFDADREIVCYLAGRMRLHNVKVLVGDTVTVVLDPNGGKNTNRIIERK